MLDPTIQGGGTIRSPVRQNARMMNPRKLPTDMNKNRNVKLMQVSSQVAETASSDGAIDKQCRPVHRQSTQTTVTGMYMNFADELKPTQCPETAVTAKEAGTDGTTNVQCRSMYYDNMRMTVMKMPTDFVKLTEPTLSRVSPVGAKMTQFYEDDHYANAHGLSRNTGTVAAAEVLGISRGG